MSIFREFFTEDIIYGLRRKITLTHISQPLIWPGGVKSRIYGGHDSSTPASITGPSENMGFRWGNVTKSIYFTWGRKIIPVGLTFPSAVRRRIRRLQGDNHKVLSICQPLIWPGGVKIRLAITKSI